MLMCTRGVLRSQVPAATNKPVVLRASGGNSISVNFPTSAWRWRWKMRCA